MTSTAILEIIDLTESPPPDNETQKVPKTTDYHSTNQDPEKNTTRAVRKRKNGEARSYPAKSPDGSLEHSRAQSGESTEARPTVDAQESNGEPRGKKKRRSKKNKDKGKKDSAPPSHEDTQLDALPNSDNEQLFFVDTAPATVPNDLAFDSSHSPSGAKVAPSFSQTSGPPDKIPLLLPAHVSVRNPGEDLLVRTIQPVESDSDSDSYIEYLDYDDRLAPGMVRYFEAAADEQKRFVCKRCGAEGEHRAKECPVLICLTCGARDEHSTRSCPISKTCFTCGMKGHINKNCPNRHSRGRVNNFDDCDRCGSDSHNTNECPTIWRLYEYVSDREREAILQRRESKQPLALGRGGEGYIAYDEWCYNCGNSGHLGDDCQELPRPHDVPDAPSAFGLWNILSGPFSLASERPMHARAPRDWENEETFGDGWGANAPINVGKRARNKARARMERRALEIQEQEQDQDDQDDWFENARNMRNRGVRRGAENGRDGPDAGHSRHHGFKKKQDVKIRILRDDPPSSPPSNHRKPSLLERVNNDDDYDHHRSHSRDHRHGHYSRDEDREYRDRDRDRGRDHERGGWERGRSRDYDRDWDRGRGELHIRGSASRNDSSRHTGLEVGEPHEGQSRRREGSDFRTRRSRDRDRDRERESRTRGPQGPQYRGGYTR